MKSNFEVMKSEIFSKLQTNTEVVESSLCSSEKVIKKLEDNLHEDLKEHSRSIISVDEIKEKLNQKEIELARRDSEVNRLHEEINQLRATVTKLTEKESLYFQEQKSKLNEILQHVDLSFSKLDNKDDSYALIRTTLETLVNQNNELSQQLSNVYMKQESCVSTVLDVNAKFDNLNAGYMNNNGMNMSSNNFQMQPTTTQCYSYNQARCISTHNKNFYQNNPTFGKSQHNPVILPSVNRPLSHFSPLPLHARKFDVLSNPSPTAVVAPMLSQPEVKKEETSLQKDCNRSQSKDVFELSSDSESGQDLCEIVSLITKKQYKKSQKARPATPSLSVTSSKSSTPVQRSIRRYGKIKKFINPFSPSPAVQTKLDKPSLRRDHNSLNDQWTQAVLAKSAKLPPQKNKFGMKSSRCSLAMKRKQGNVFNFDGESDEDLKNIADMLQTKQRPRKRR
ncbi:uncharacterized protein LOC130626158 [Hydractinia symbiolongicarpus]|uniref:uncharacterized protein LOC130626158 n=1 Tax=Hydractinia symbiolongicarpus TaxID=13093 RepID=UPI00254A0C22|nr:uncharacterized protein LOC130626158 [Hydractinia symbiolongicarpus]